MKTLSPLVPVIPEPFDGHLPEPDPVLTAAAVIAYSRLCIAELEQEVADCWNRSHRARAEGNRDIVEMEARLLPTLHAEIRRHLRVMDEAEGLWETKPMSWLPLPALDILEVE